MLGYDPIIALPLLLLVAIFVTYTVLGLLALLKIASLSCEVCGRALTTDSAMRLHMAEHRRRITKHVTETHEIPKAA